MTSSCYWKCILQNIWVRFYDISSKTKLKGIEFQLILFCVWRWVMSCITVTAWWAQLRLKSPKSWLFAQPFVQLYIKHQSSASLAFEKGIHRRRTGGSPSQRVGSAENVPFHDVIVMWIVVAWLIRRLTSLAPDNIMNIRTTVWLFQYQGHVSRLQSDAVASRLANGSAAFIWKLGCHWLRGLRQRQIAVVI